MKTRTELLPGVFLTSIRTDKFKTGCFSINFVRPLCHEEAGKNALFPSILLRGSEQYPTMKAISDELDEMYGATVGALLRKKGEVQMTGFYADFIEDDLVGEALFARVMRFVFELLFHPVLENGGFRADYFESEKRVQLNAIAARINNKRGYAVNRMLSVMCADEAFRVLRIGDAEDLDGVTPENLYAHYRNVLATSGVELFYMGRKTTDEVAALLRGYLKELPRGQIVQTTTRVIPAASRVHEVTESLDVTQGKLCMGFRTGCAGADREYPALMVMNTIFGGGVTSKLFLKVREEMGLCYYAGSACNKMKGILHVSAGIEFDKYETAKNEILHQLSLCCEGEITDEELESARRYLLSELKLALDNPGQLDDFYVGQAVAGLDGTFEQLAEDVARVTKDDVIRAAKKITLDTVYFLKGEQA